MSGSSNALFERWGGVRRSRADENGAYCRRPPLAPALRGRDMFSVELARDLAQALALGVSSADVSNQLGRESRPSTGPRSLANSRRLPALDEVALELGDWDQPCTPFRLHCCDRRDDTAIERCEAYTDRIGGLLARVGEPLDPLRELDVWRRGRRCSWCVAVLFVAPSSLPSVRHPYTVQQSCGCFAPRCICVSLAIAVASSCTDDGRSRPVGRLSVRCRG